MAKPKRTLLSGTFFVTTIAQDRRRRFQVERNALSVLEALQEYRSEGLYKLHAFVVMPDHMHILITTEKLPKAIQSIKGGSSRKIASHWKVWQDGYSDHAVFSASQYQSHLHYIHQNPVRAGLVEKAEDYPYSSAYRESKQVVAPTAPLRPSAEGKAH